MWRRWGPHLNKYIKCNLFVFHACLRHLYLLIFQYQLIHQSNYDVTTSTLRVLFKLKYIRKYAWISNILRDKKNMEGCISQECFPPPPPNPPKKCIFYVDYWEILHNCTIRIPNDRFMKLNYCHVAEAQWWVL